MSNSTPEELVEEAKKPGVFNIINVLKERAYPTDDIEISLDEVASYEAALIGEKIDVAGEQLLNISDPDEINKAVDAIEKLKKQRQKILDSIAKNMFTFKIAGISEGKRDELYQEAVAKFPIEYTESSNPLLGETKREEVKNVERDKFFTSLLWAEHIQAIVDPSGSEQGKLTVDDVNELRNNLPISATTKLNEAIEKIRVATAMFMIGVDEDFLAKS